MSTAGCWVCGRTGRVERDHPDGRVGGKPLHPQVVVVLCKPCHLRKGRFDRAAGVEGGHPTPGLRIARRASFSTFLARSGDSLWVPSVLWRDQAMVLEDVARKLGFRRPT
jgi:hypothetical protein